MIYKQGILTGITVFIFFILITSISFYNGQNADMPKVKPQYELPTLEYPEQLTFAGEPVPINYKDVRESLERELYSVAYFHSNTFLMLKKANKFFPDIEKILKQNNIPEDFKYLSVTESGLENVISPAGAVGFWQFLEKTGKEYGLEINDEIDERYHYEKSTEAACKYLNDRYKSLNDWALVAASYNMGEAALNKQIERQKSNSYYDLLLNPETARYVYRILAYKIIMSNPTKYGFFLTENDLYQPIDFKNIELKKEVEHWADFAQKHKTNYKILKNLNPWLRSVSLENKKNNTYIVKVPKKGERTFTIEKHPEKYISYPTSDTQ